MSDIVVIGSLNMDLVAITPRMPHVGETITGHQFLTEPGGKGANQAYAAARLGGAVSMLGCVGTDDHGRRMCENLAAAGCDVRNVRAVEGASGVAMILVADTGENSIVVIPGANHRFTPADVAEAKLERARHVLLQLEIPPETVLAAAETAKRAGARVILDPAPAPSALAPALLRCVDILTPNETEAAALIGRPPGALGVDESRDIALRLKAMGPAAVIVKLGAQGCMLADAGSTTFIPAPRVSAIDTTAAGDVFNGALAVAVTEGASLVEACRFAVRAASLSVTRLAAQRSMPSREEVQSFQESGEPRVVYG